MIMRAAAIILVLAIAACGTASPVGSVRFVNTPPVWKVNDRTDVPTQPAENPFYRPYYHFTSYLLLARRHLSLTREQRARGVNSLDEVPDSTWFTNRVGMREVTPAEVAQGAPGETPYENLPWTIKSAKEGGSVPGFICEDSKGRKFLLKFSPKDEPELDSAADVITARILWAAGYNVPSDHVVFFDRKDLVVGDTAYKKIKGEKQPLTEQMVDDEFARALAQPTGKYRGTASLYITGKPLGGSHRLGTRKDDPNDVIPHELRRDQRGMAAFAAWLAHTDMKEDNTLESWEEDPADKSTHYVVHYHIDFGNSLGAFPRSNRRPQPDFTYEVDPYEFTWSFLTLGLRRQPWEGRVDPEIPGLGMYSAEDYRPEGWKPNPIGHLPVYVADRFDQFWGAKIIIEMTRAQLAAAIEQGKLTDPRAAPYLLETLIKRQRRTALHWFTKVNPVDDFVLETADRVCFDDLIVKHHLADWPVTYTVDAYDNDGRALAGSLQQLTPDATGKTCTTKLPRGGTAVDGRYTILRIETSRGIPGTLVHIADDPDTSQPRVIGLHRL